MPHAASRDSSSAWALSSNLRAGCGVCALQAQWQPQTPAAGLARRRSTAPRCAAPTTQCTVCPYLWWPQLRILCALCCCGHACRRPQRPPETHGAPAALAVPRCHIPWCADTTYDFNGTEIVRCPCFWGYQYIYNGTNVSTVAGKQSHYCCNSVGPAIAQALLRLCSMNQSQDRSVPAVPTCDACSLSPSRKASCLPACPPACQPACHTHTHARTHAMYAACYHGTDSCMAMNSNFEVAQEGIFSCSVSSTSHSAAT